MKQFDIIVIGGGIVGLATAYKILKQRPGLSLLLIEKEKELVQHQTGNNSGVIHSGLYYKPGSLKALNCINGYNQLIKFCDEEGIPYDLCGKIVVATKEEQIPLLEKLHQRGQQNGLENLTRITADEIKDYEPYANGVAALHVPQTGIIDYKLVGKRLADKIHSFNASFMLGEKVTDMEQWPDGNVVVTKNGSFKGKVVVNCAGLYSDKVAAFTNSKLDVKIIPFRGEYYKLKKARQYLVKNLIYPVPDPNFPFLGVHFTRMINGGIEAGPNAVFAFGRESYKKSQINWPETIEAINWPGFQKVIAKYWQTGMGEIYRSWSKSAFTKALQELIPDVKEDDLEPGGAGIRAQACDRKGGLIDDFLILEDKCSVHVCNAPSPAATSSLSIGDTVAGKALSRF